MLKRVGRIYPGLWFVVIMNTILIGIFYGGYAHNIFITLSWIFAQMTVGQFYTPEFLRGYGVGAPNGSLWTIPVEIQFYVLIVPIVRYFKTSKSWLYLIIVSIITSILIWYMSTLKTGMYYKILTVSFFPYIYMYLIGGFFAVFDSKIKKMLDYKFVIFVSFALWIVVRTVMHIPIIGVYIGIIDGLFLSLATIILGFSYKFNLSFDFSYGIYLWHMVFVNFFVESGNIGNNFYVLFVIAMSFIMAGISWFYVEKNGKKIFTGGIINQ